jgi:cob(I)alamin adenosyltransferase
MSIYTRIGDDGTTALFGGKRIKKSDALIDAYGSVDELNSYIGLLIASSPIHGSYIPLLIGIQKDLMYISSTLAGWKSDEKKVLLERVEEMEQWIDEAEKDVGKLQTFILPCGSQAAAVCHITRTVCRRAERQIVAAHIHDHEIISYMNRLSDLFFMMARVINKAAGVSETIWIGNTDKKK